MTPPASDPSPSASSSPSSILVLGAGLVARPAVRYLLDHGFRVTVASRTVSKAERLVGDHERGRALSLDVNDKARLSALIAEHDLTMSLLPATRHVEVAELCLEHGRHMTTTSYIQPAMRALHEAARDAGLTFLNECGVDPGIDHMTAMRIFDDVTTRGGRVVSFRSYCGGLPAPEANDNPLGYKFSWAPRGVLVAARNPARYRLEGEIVEVAPDDLLTDVHLLEVPGAGTFEAYPNRDSLRYLDMYGLGELDTMFRGTLRIPGHCARWKAWGDLGLFSPEPRSFLSSTQAGILRELLGVGPGANLEKAVARRLDLDVDSDPVQTLGWLGFYDEVPLPEGLPAPIDILAHAMLERMRYQEGERDMIVMHHSVVSVFDDHREHTTMNLVDFGIPQGDSSMARTVSLPVAIATRLILEARVTERGVQAPVTPAFYEPILEELESQGIHCREETRQV